MLPKFQAMSRTVDEGEKRMSRKEAKTLLITVNDAWEIKFNKKSQRRLPSLLVREFVLVDYLAGARFVQRIATVAQILNHFPPTIRLERRIVSNSLQTVCRIECGTTVLKGLSRPDFQLAMVRPYVFVLEQLGSGVECLN